MLSSNQELFLQLVKSGIEHSIGPLSESTDWGTIESLALRQGLSAIVVDGVDHLPESQRPPKEILLQWIGNTLQSYEYRFELYRRTIAEMASWYNSHGFKMMVLKGYACSLNWPKPEHRPCGDIDIWLFGKQKEADRLVEKEKSIKIDTSHHHHTVFNWKDFTVENHYDFVNIHAEQSSAELEKVFKELGKDDSHTTDVSGETIYMPSPNLHALFLIRHIVSHFAAAEISLRQVLDWAFFVENHATEIDWKWLLGILDEYHMRDFFNLINAICVDDLGYKTEIFPEIHFLPALKERVLKDILDPEFTAAEPASFFPRIVYKYRRWQGNAWKQKLCYSESRWEMFWRGIWAKLIKPASI